ncbi:MAG: pirin family protein [Sphaerochaeta sp.]|jgi:redox-sensitive bicupin YhaK (pirin superfamily)|nr:pirin family protein [Spirochaetota bacterium]TAH56678.1 MAG: pirin family protein [Sphaerochaeta sp.]
MKKRTIRRITGGKVSYDGAGVKLVRVIGYDDVKDFDPFLMLDAFDSKNPEDYIKGFPWHPHRGIETVTYLISGLIEHGDSLGNSGLIDDGSCQWMTAGSGIIHQEMPLASDHMLGAQLWINLPQTDKMTEPAYRDIRPSQIPVVREEGCSVRIISGSYKETVAPNQGEYVKTTCVDVDLKPGVKWTIGTDDSLNVFTYIVAGSAVIDGQEVESRRAVLFTKGDTLTITAGEEGLRFFYYAGKPLSEPIAWAGPIVMNTSEELRLARKELMDGTFIKHA